MKLNLDRISKELENRAKQALKESAVDVLAEVVQKSPVDTWEYLKGNKISPIDTVWDQTGVRIYNDSENAEEVEYWFSWNPVNWHKNRKWGWPVIYSWVWARVYTRTYDEKKNEVIKNFKNKLWL